MFTGFGTENVQGLLNGLLWGPDGWIYGVASSNGGDDPATGRGPSAKPVSVRGRDFRFKPDGSAFEAISGGGQFGHSLRRLGASVHLQQQQSHPPDRPAVALSRAQPRALIRPAVILDIAAEGPAAPVFRISPPEPWRVVRTRQRAADPVMRQRLAADRAVRDRLLHLGDRRHDLPRLGLSRPSIAATCSSATWAATSSIARSSRSTARRIWRRRADAKVEFLASTDNWFRPVNFANTPDGTLLILDMYRETIEHPLSIPEPIKKHLDLTSGKDRGRLYNLVQHGGRRRRQAQAERGHVGRAGPSPRRSRRLVARDGPAALDRAPRPLGRPGSCERWSRSGRPHSARLHALWALDVLGLLGR